MSDLVAKGMIRVKSVQVVGEALKLLGEQKVQEVAEVAAEHQEVEAQAGAEDKEAVMALVTMVLRHQYIMACLVTPDITSALLN